MKKEINEKSFISKRFNELKELFELNNSQLAVIAGVTPTTIREIVEGMSENPKMNIIGNICKGLKLNYEWFFEESAPLKKEELNDPTKTFLMEELERYRKREQIWFTEKLGKTEGGLIRPYGSFFLYLDNPYVNPPIGMQVHSTPTNN